MFCLSLPFHILLQMENDSDNSDNYGDTKDYSDKDTSDYKEQSSIVNIC